MLTAAKKYGLLALIVVAIVWFLYVAIESTSFQICIADKENKQTDQSTEKQPSEVLRSFIVSARVRTDCVSNFLYDNRDAVTAIATAFISIFTFTLWRSTDRLWATAKDQIAAAENASKIQSTDMQASIAVANKAADAAKQSADAVVSQLRAYASVTAASIHGFQQDGPICLKIRIENRGQTPAYGLTHDGGFTLREADVSRFKGDLWPPERNMLLSKATLPPGVIRHASMDVPIPLSPDAKAAIRDGTLALFAYGEIRYSDAFGNPRKSTYRLMYGGSAPVTNDQLTICEEGNCED
jgi:hypothetical protein